MQRRLKQALSSLREHSYVSYAKLATLGGFCDLDCVIVKATSPDDLPVPERYVSELLKIFSISPTSFGAFSLSFIRRFGKTQSWRVALKCLLILHRLLRSLPDNTLFRAELLRTKANGLMSLYPCHFKDCSSSYSQHYTSFIKSYAHLLDVTIELCFPITVDRLDDKIEEAERMIQGLNQLQSLIDRIMDCRPTGVAARSFVVQSAMKYIIRDSFTSYTNFQDEIVVVLDNLIQLPQHSSLAAFDIYKKAELQAHQLHEFYGWCKSMGFCGYYEYPFVDRIPRIQIEALGSLLNGMWNSSSASSTFSPFRSTSQSPVSSTEDDTDKPVIKSDTFSTDRTGHPIHETLVMYENDWARFDEPEMNRGLKKDKEMEPLIQSEVDNVGWEALLEASIETAASLVSENNIYSNAYGHDYQHGNCSVNGFLDQANGWQMQIYKPQNPQASNPFQQPCNTPVHYGSFSNHHNYADLDPLIML